ncbi:MLV-related proviral Env polyprotein-like [Catharus ustulatus]|uniref:MLV-related proviral Env polyprotein-like n=1 Tax=Catharus ustulatus TaxID=91951 RepID=UPI00140D2E57|nr:MLV-related proviral Env polyprotein-like [Catharus ustulatus]
MVNLAVSSNLTGERGRRVKGGDKESHIETTKKMSTTYDDRRLGNNRVKGTRKRVCFVHITCTRHHLILIMHLIIVMKLIKGVESSHEPFKWSLIKWEDSRVVRTVITAGSPSFQVSLTELVTFRYRMTANKYKAVYMCPAFNPGKPYCNYPGYNFCAYWGCETLALGFHPGGPPDQYLKIGRGPHGCKPPRYNYSWGIKGGDHTWCQFIHLNVTRPDDPVWIIGKTWGLMALQPGTDQGVMILIKKEPIPHDPEPVGPNPVIGEGGQRNIVNTSTPNTSALRENATETKNETKNWPEKNQPVQEYNTLWKVMQATFKVLNDTYPNITKECWLCYMVKPPFYEAIGSTAEHRWVNGTNPRECLWRKEQDNTPGISLAQVRGKGRCVGNIPKDKNHLCKSQMVIPIPDPKKPAQWLLPAVNTKWVCNTLGVTPCLAVNSFDITSEYCIQVLILPRIAYHSKDYVHEQHITSKNHLTKREPFTALTVAVLLSVGGAGVGTGVASLVNQQQGMKDLRISVDEDLQKINTAINGLVKSVRSLSEVVLQNRRGLDLLFLQQGGLCVALREECCTYVDHTGVAVDAMAELKKQIEQRKREREAQQSWYESWFNHSPWFTTLLSSLAGPLILFVLTLTFGPCIFNKLINIVKRRLEAAHLMLIRAKYEPLNKVEMEDYLELSRKELVRYSEQKE